MAANDMKQILRTREQIRLQLSPFARALHTLTENGDMVRLNELTRAAIRPIEEFSRRADYVSLALQSMEEFQRIQALVQATDKRFYLPEITDAIHLLTQFENSALSSVIERYQLQATQIHRSFEVMSKSWLDVENKLQSIDGFVALTGIGQTLNTMRPFEAVVTEALRIDLGDWRNDIIWPSNVSTDPVVRTSFYEDLGLNPNLTAFPAATFEELVISSGIQEISEPDASELCFDSTEEETELEAGFNRTNEAHDTIQRFETQIRDFLEQRMNEEFGTNWTKHRVPGEIKKQWSDKQQKARADGETAWPLIAYADFSDYIKIITRGDNWKEVFGEIFIRKSSVQESFQRLLPIRRATMHSRIITQDDELLLFVETKRILKAIRQFKA